MSRGFVKEDDQEEVPMVPPRAFLPAGVPNFVTPFGMKQLLEEQHLLLNEKNNVHSTNENEKRIALNVINAKLQLLNARIAEAKVVDPTDGAKDDVCFGATVTFKSDAAKNNQTFQIVGVDEANISEGKVSFLSPIAKVLLNKKIGDTVVLKHPNKDIVLTVIAVSYRQE